MIRHCEFRNARIRYKDEGKGRAIILLHGFLESLEIWNNLSKRLSKSYRVISIDLPGHGGSSNYGYIHTMEMMAEAVHQVVKKLRLRKIVMTGHSMGGYVTLAYAELFPDDLKGFSLFHSTAVNDTTEKKKERLRAVEAIKAHPKKFVKGLFENLFHEENRKRFTDTISELSKAATDRPVEGYTASILGMRERVNREVVLKFSPSPVLIIAGKEDPIIPYTSLEKQSRYPQKGRYHLLERSAHLGFIEEPEKSEKILRSFYYCCFRRSC